MRLTWMSPDALQNWMSVIHASMTISIFISVGERNIMNHFVVNSLTPAIYFWSLVRADLPVDGTPAMPPHRRFLADSWAGQKYLRASRACPDLTVQR
jgi:hypothetical protein